MLPHDLTSPHFSVQYVFGIHCTPDGHLLISYHASHCVLVFKEGIKYTSAFEGTIQGKKRFSTPCGVVMMNNGDIVIADCDNNRVVVF